MGPASNRGRLFYAGLALALLSILGFVLTMGQYSTWEDETFPVSTGYSIARGAPANLSVLGLFPRTISPIRFYGPVSFEVSAFLIRLFGLSPAAWRLVCFSGVILCAAVSAAIVRRAGGDRWAHLMTLVILLLLGSISSAEPGRFDFVSAGIFLAGLLLLLPIFLIGARNLFWRVLLAGACLGFALGSTPRTLTLTAAAVSGILVAAAAFKKLRKRLLLCTFGFLSIGVIVHSALLSPWKLNTFSWYAFVRHASKQDTINASPLVGPGGWHLQLQYDKTLLALWILLTLLGIFGFLADRRARSSGSQAAVFISRKDVLPARLFLSLFATVNLALMFLLLTRPLGQSPFWAPPLLIAAMSWFDWERLRVTRWRTVSMGLISACILILAVRYTERVGGLALAGRRFSRPQFTAFLRRTLPRGAVVFGPLGGYFYEVQAVGDTYLYPMEVTTPGLYSGPRAVIPAVIDREICTHPVFIIWPQWDPALHTPWWAMPVELQQRRLPAVGKFHESPVAPWRERWLRYMGVEARAMDNKYGFYDATVWPLRSLSGCAK